MAIQDIDNTAPYCGDPPMKAARLFTRHRNGGVPRLFEGRDVRWSFNARVAIRAACDLLQLTPGDEVLAPAYNCGSELDPLIHAGLTVTLYPVGRDGVADPEQIAAQITSCTRAVYVTHYFGFLQPHLDDIRALCDARGLRLIEDCALTSNIAMWNLWYRRILLKNLHNHLPMTAIQNALLSLTTGGPVLEQNGNPQGD